MICAASNMQRAYPAMAIEIQQRAGHRRLRFRHERRLLVGDVRASRHAADIGARGHARVRAGGEPRDLLGPPELRATATATSSSATSPRP